ncbi:hypothetical protein CRG98_023015 [Punica granatum]|uniref:Uncharacterized protein n=1 Tax=Punica granatum TaxID=22663 RepID=A0A2I0JK47_PUNGR|nr:hypothetical protein CRG98_023015 [Punica granatum]
MVVTTKVTVGAGGGRDGGGKKSARRGRGASTGHHTSDLGRRCIETLLATALKGGVACEAPPSLLIYQNKGRGNPTGHPTPSAVIEDSNASLHSGSMQQLVQFWWKGNGTGRELGPTGYFDPRLGHNTRIF